MLVVEDVGELQAILEGAEGGLGEFGDEADVQREVGQIVLDPDPAPRTLEGLGVAGWAVSELQEGEAFEAESLRHRSLFVARGKFTVTPRGGHPVLATPGALLILPKGLVSEWRAHEPCQLHWADHD